MRNEAELPLRISVSDVVLEGDLVRPAIPPAIVTAPAARASGSWRQDEYVSPRR